jgi:hypothetical protein
MALKITPKHITLALVGWAFALTAAAQWQWVDKDGRKVFSDTPPPPSVQERNILKQPPGRPVPSTPESGAALTSSASPPASAGTLKISGKDSELEAAKKKLEEEKAAKKKLEDEKLAQNRAVECERARKGLATFKSGVRIMTINASGEREFMDEKTRAVESTRLQSIVESDCRN